MYKTIDLTKFLLSFIVIAIHTSCVTLKPQSIFLDLIWGLPVPIFFLISGFFLFKSYQKGGIEKINQYINKLIKLYILYTLIYMPLTFYGWHLSNNSIWLNILSFIRNILLTGENYYSWPLWYLLALIVSTFIIKILLYYKIKIYNIFFIGFALTLMGICINYFVDIKTNTFIDTISTLYKNIFVSTRNGFFVGFGYVSTGFLIAYFENKLFKYSLLFYLILVISCILNLLYKIPLSLNIISTILFIILIQKNIYKKSNNIWLRNMSTLIYFFHMYFVFLLMIIIKITNSQIPFIYGFIAISIIVTIFCALILNLSNTKHFLFFKKLLG